MRRAVAIFAVCLLLPDAYAHAAAGRAEQVRASLTRGAQFLASRQGEDGSWRSGVHGSFRDGPSLSPHVLASLCAVQDVHPTISPELARGRRYLLELRDTHELRFPIYSATSICRVVAPDAPDARDRWIAYVRARQLNEANGWSRRDPEFGGWGYCPTIPRKPPPGQGRGLMMDSNLSATMYAVEALRAASAPGDDPALADALVFIDRCQNFAPGAARADERFDDGGFFFMPGDATRNKAGPSGTDRFGIERYHSYGSATADGIRAMLACGRPSDHPRVLAASRWLARHFDATGHAGTFNRDRSIVRAGNYFYYCWSVAHALEALNVREVETSKGTVRWAEALTDALLARQRDDGAWANDVSDGREDDPLVATPFAVEAIATCRRVADVTN